MGKKKWYQSKTIKLNVLAGVLIAAQALAGQFIVNPEIQGLVLSGINLGLRFVTTQGIEVKE